MSREKAAVIIIIDIGHSESLSVQEKSNFLKQCRECSSMIMQRKMFSSPKDEVGVILMGSEDSNNELYNGEIYGNISVALPLRVACWDAVRKFEAETNETNITVNWVEAVTVALHYLRKESEMKKFTERKVVLFTGNLENGSPENVSLIEDDMKNLKADLIVIYPSQTDETEVEKAKEIVEQVNGSLHDLDQAIPQLMAFQKRKVKPQAWNVCLDIGSKVKIPVTGYKKLNDSQKFVWQFCTASDDDSKTRIEREVTYHREDNIRVVESDLIDGYKYGATLVPFTEDDKKQLGYVSGPKCLSLLKVTKAAFVPRHMWLGNSVIIFVARDNDENAAAAFSAVVHALDQLKSVAIVRRVYNNGNRPRMGALMPCVKSKKEYLMYVELPFSQDLRHCLRTELDTGNVKEEQLNAIDRLIESMDLSVPVQADDSEDDNTTEREWGELLKPHQIFDPYLQHVRKCISSRMLHPEMPLPDPKGDIQCMVEPPSPLKKAADGCLKEILTLFPDLEAPKTKESGKRSIDVNAAKMKDEVNDEESVSKRKKTAESEYVGLFNPSEDFKTAIEEKNISFSQVCHQMQHAILQLVINSFGKEDFVKPQESLKLLRSSIINAKNEKSDAVLSYNAWMRKLQTKLHENLKIGFWRLVIQEKLGFITCEECPESLLSSDEVREIIGADTTTHEDMDVSGLLDDDF